LSFIALRRTYQRAHRDLAASIRERLDRWLVDLSLINKPFRPLNQGLCRLACLGPASEAIAKRIEVRELFALASGWVTQGFETLRNAAGTVVVSFALAENIHSARQQAIRFITLLGVAPPC